MTKSELSALESQLSTLPHMQKAHLLNLLTELVESQTTYFIENESDVTCCRHCACSSIKKWGKSAGLQRYKCKNLECAKTLMPLQALPYLVLDRKISGLTIFNVCLTACL